MKTHILLTLLTAFILTACASKEHISAANSEDERNEYSKFEAQAGRVR